jgi:CTP synthase
LTKHIFVTGGVISSLGKGLTSASLGMLLASRGFRVNLQKFDPYINVDPGTMSPFQHGEVYVTEDGAETDLDLGHYERFTGVRMKRGCNWTTGTIFRNVIEKERAGAYLGKTVQYIPHITDEIKSAIRLLATGETDILITEIGGTVGDIESLVFLEAVRQFRLERGRDNVLFIHLTLIPYIRAAQELKTKPTQHSVGKLREIGIEPDLLICRTEKPLGREIREKISLFTNVPVDYVIEEQDLLNRSIYELPLVLAEQGVDELIVRALGLKSPHAPDLAEWQKMVAVLRDPRHKVRIAVVGKYTQLQDAYKSIYEAIRHGGIANEAEVETVRVDSEEIEKDGPAKFLEGVDGILVPGGFGARGIEGKIAAVQYARENRVPFYGICLGMQCATIEVARNVLGLQGANSTEFDKLSKYPVIDMMVEQKSRSGLGGTMRLGAYACRVKKGTHAAEAYGRDLVQERHRHRYEFNNAFRMDFEEHGVIFSGVNPETNLVEIMELKDHPWFVAVQFHPEFHSRPVAAHPLFAAFIKHALEYGKKGKS